jgi:hypothetical protein
MLVYVRINFKFSQSSEFGEESKKEGSKLIAVED